VYLLNVRSLDRCHMADSNVLDVFRDRHREYLNSIDLAWVNFNKKRNRLRIMLRTQVRLPPTWIRSLNIDLFHDTFAMQERAKDLVWTDTEGTLLVATCTRPEQLLPDRDLRDLGESILPIGDVILFAAQDTYEHPLYNEASRKVHRRLIDRY